MIKRILYFMPDNPMSKNSGNKTHVLQMLDYFASRQNKVQLDYLGEETWSQWSAEDKKAFNEKYPSINLHVLRRKGYKKNLLKYFFTYTLINTIKKNRLLFFKKSMPDNNTHILQKKFNKLLAANVYDVIILSYVTWASLIYKNKLTGNARLILDTHDFITALHKNKRGFNMGKAFAAEMKIINMFNDTWNQSADERYLFSQFAENTQHYFVPIMFKKTAAPDASPKNIDLIYVGSDNESNRVSIQWFFKEVYPLLPDNINICCIGKICNYIPEGLVNVTKHIFVDDLTEFYYASKIAICPMLKGTGVKVKVVEAVAFGLPVVCNLRGLDGLPIKENNGCLLSNTAQQFADNILHLLSDEAFYTQTAQQATAMFTQYFEQEKCYTHLDKILQLD